MSDSSHTTTLPPRFEDAQLDHLVVLIADMLQRLIIHNDKIPLSPESLTRFHSRSPPAITVLEYLRRIAKYTNVERTCLIITLHYIDQICARVARFTISSLTVHRFIIASIAVSSKALCDVFCTNSFYAKVGGLRVMELNVLEKDLLAAIDWRLTCTRELLQEYYVNLVRTHSTGQYKIDDLQVPLTSSASDISRSPSASPVIPAKQEQDPDPLAIAEPSSVLMGKTVSPPSSPPAQTGPSALEQNMAFAALQVVMSPCVGASILPEKRTSAHLVDQPDVDTIRPVKRKLGT
ncbi:cyclin-domain-containing protein [Gautieria morchelliformis]|nr:cyclin-domain-containing protein [Gautieria morchelliformis]